jgi:hypothetical protein
MLLKGSIAKKLAFNRSARYAIAARLRLKTNNGEKTNARK